MADTRSRILLCTCDKSMDLDQKALASAVPAPRRDAPAPEISSCNYLCRDDGDLFLRSLKSAGEGGTRLVVACEQEAATFEEMALDADLEPAFQVVDIRDRAGWSDEGAFARPKIEALLAEAALEAPATPIIDISSEGVCLIYGPSEIVLGAARRLGAHLSVTAIVTDGDAEIIPPARLEAPIFRGDMTRAAGQLGAFQVQLDRFAEMKPGGRGVPTFGELRNGAKSRCDVIVDLSGGQALFPAHEKRDGYHRADPRDPVAVERALFDAAQMSGTFEKPLYIRFEATLCAHQRAGQGGCTRCLDVCPTGAITAPGSDEAGVEHVTLDPKVCAGCGSCAAVCPSGAAQADHPALAFQLKRLRTLADTFDAAGGNKPPRLLIHDEEHGREMIALAARYGRGLPAEVIPFAVSEIGGVGHMLLLAALASGFCEVRILPGPRSERSALDAQIDLAGVLAEGVGQGGRISLLDVSDPDALSEAFYATPDATGKADAEAKKVFSVEPVLLLGEGRDVVRLSLSTLAQGAVPAPFDLPSGAPYGTVEINRDACTLCLSCVSLCPSGALTDNPDRPEVRFQEDACLQCGICRSACPENAIRPVPRYDLSKAAMAFQVMHEEEPAKCIECGAPFGVKSTIDRVIEKLEGKHWMFKGSDNARLIQMCDDCRVNAQFATGNDPFAMGKRPRVRVTEDYLNGSGDDT